MKVLRFKAKVWRWPGYAGWHFVNMPKKLAKEIGKVGKRYGSGFIKAKVTVGKSTWVTSLFPHKESDTYLVSIKKQIRKKEEIFEDDNISITFQLI